ncbi:hypothetical protein BV882_01680 [Streptomyces sp. 46]|nr:hypothetical protein BV882_01680 [Streptomyces sp. 46]
MAKGSSAPSGKQRAQDAQTVGGGVGDGRLKRSGTAGARGAAPQDGAAGAVGRALDLGREQRVSVVAFVQRSGHLTPPARTVAKPREHRCGRRLR